ncbi:MAG: hypothetical protein JW957_03190 [Candidatus Omnitrophica bacterium]|nr:hypothetical protein [Candidatus Omnitrophota bacterium]
MEKGKTVKIGVLVIIILGALAVILGRTAFRGDGGTGLTPEQQAEQERWQNMTPEEKDAAVRKDMQEQGVPPEKIEEMMRRAEETKKDIGK